MTPLHLMYFWTLVAAVTFAPEASAEGTKDGAWYVSGIGPVFYSGDHWPETIGRHCVPDIAKSLHKHVLNRQFEQLEQRIHLDHPLLNQRSEASLRVIDEYRSLEIFTFPFQSSTIIVKDNKSGTAVAGKLDISAMYSQYCK